MDIITYALLKKAGGMTPEQSEQLKKLITDLNTANGKIQALESKTDATELQVETIKTSYIKAVEYVEGSGIFRFTLQDGSIKTVDLAIEKVVTNFEYIEADQVLRLTLADGSHQDIPIAKFITVYKGSTGEQIIVSIDNKETISARLSEQVATNIAKGVEANTKAAALEARVTANESSKQDAEQVKGLIGAAKIQTSQLEGELILNCGNSKSEIA